MGSDGSHFNVSLIVQGKVTRQCPSITIVEEKGEPKREVEPASFRLPALPPGQAGSQVIDWYKSTHVFYSCKYNYAHAQETFSAG